MLAAYYGMIRGASMEVCIIKALPRTDLNERALIGFLGRGPQVLLQEIPQLAGPFRVSKLAKRFGFYLTNTFPGHTELLTCFF